MILGSRCVFLSGFFTQMSFRPSSSKGGLLIRSFSFVTKRFLHLYILNAISNTIEEKLLT